MAEQFDLNRTYAIDGYTTSRHTGQPEPVAMHVEVPGEYVPRVLAMYEGQSTIHSIETRPDGVI